MFDNRLCKGKSELLTFWLVCLAAITCVACYLQEMYANQKKSQTETYGLYEEVHPCELVNFAEHNRVGLAAGDSEDRVGIAEADREDRVSLLQEWKIASLSD